MKKPLLAEEALRDAIGLGPKLIEDNFIVPYATVELAMLMLDQKEVAKATTLLEEAKWVILVHGMQPAWHVRPAGCIPTIWLALIGLFLQEKFHWLLSGV